VVVEMVVFEITIQIGRGTWTDHHHHHHHHQNECYGMWEEDRHSQLIRQMDSIEKEKQALEVGTMKEEDVIGQRMRDDLLQQAKAGAEEERRGEEILVMRREEQRCWVVEHQWRRLSRRSDQRMEQSCLAMKLLSSSSSASVSPRELLPPPLEGCTDDSWRKVTGEEVKMIMATDASSSLSQVSHQLIQWRRWRSSLSPRHDIAHYTSSITTETTPTTSNVDPAKQMKPPENGNILCDHHLQVSILAVGYYYYCYYYFHILSKS